MHLLGHPPDPAAVGAVIDEVRWRFDLDADLTSFQTLAAGDPLLGPAVERRRGMRVNAFQSLYEFLVITVVLQNATVRRSVQMMENLFAGFGGRAAFDGRELSCFWEPARLAAAPEEDLRGLKVGYRATTLLRQAAAFRGGGLDERDLRRLGKDHLTPIWCRRRRSWLRRGGAGGRGACWPPTTSSRTCSGGTARSRSPGSGS